MVEHKPDLAWLAWRLFMQNKPNSTSEAAGAKHLPNLSPLARHLSPRRDTESSQCGGEEDVGGRGEVLSAV